MAMGWTEYVLKDEEVLLKDAKEVPQRPKRVASFSSSMFALQSSDPLLVPAGTVDGLK